ncbi:MurT ligase domain-containing protein [Brockia lithotrophica]|uniref:Lipid II isoglutaminyl synthase (glutamine-hydrolyzing) subunit MurT n=1 Tax=Brockia lithotrophica TaxID=933949 RepID=A0A660KST7_9BACL|nr:MurT ligase domain-containing protein [Brockia lithotrophica]RKQ83524.1 UDP-N-acetylmuramyl tripeptide synthase [Brockia lithotrophica]
MSYFKVLRTWAAIGTAKAIKRLLMALGRKGTTLPGAIALRICPDLLRYYGKKLEGRVVFVTGTNGKTTTSNILTYLLKKNGNKVISNALGANLIEGITTAFIEGFAASNNNQLAVIEVDEATLCKVIDHIPPKVVVVTNFFRDQLDRYGELEAVVDMVERALKRTPPYTIVVVNADDPLASSVAPQEKKTIFYGVESTKMPMNKQEEIRDGKLCRRCGALLRYQLYYYGQLGFYECPVCGFRRPTPDVTARNVRLQDGGVAFELDGESGFVDTPAFYNVYNVLAAIAAAKVLGVKPMIIAHEMKRLKIGLGRMERFMVGNEMETWLVLVKNPTGCNQVLKTIIRIDRPITLVFILNDRDADGTDVSWIWDVHLEQLKEQKNIKRIIAAGTRAYDIAVRLKYADLKDVTMIREGDVSAVEVALSELTVGHTLVILSTYTSLYAVRDYLLKKGGVYVET